MKRWFLVSACLILSSVSHITPASVTTGKMKVIVRDAEGGPLRGARVTAQTEDSLTSRTASADDNGEAMLLGLDPSTKYVVTTLFPGYTTSQSDNVPVRLGKTTTLHVGLQVDLTGGLVEELVVTAEAPVVDTTTAIQKTHFTIDFIEDMPGPRTYQGIIQNVPGVGFGSMPGFGDDPFSRSGLNMNAFSGSGGWSADNYYYIEGINVTSIWFGQSSANFNTEMIQEQSVITGGISAEHKGAPGLISHVVTKSGGNDFSGSVNYFLQHDGLMESNRRGDWFNNEFRNYDTAITLGGPIKRDKLWFFLSYRKDNRKDYVVNGDPVGGFTRTVEEDEDQYYAKLTWQMTNKDRLTGTFVGDPREDTGSANAGIVNDRLNVVERGSDRYVVNYQRVFGSGILELSASEHADEFHGKPVLLEPRNDILFDFQQPYTIADEQLGGAGILEDWKDTNEVFNGSVEWLVKSSWGHHTIKGGFEFEDHTSDNDIGRVGGAYYRSLNTGLSALLGSPPTAGYVASGSLTGGFAPFDVYWAPDFNGFCERGIGGMLTGSGCQAPTGGFPQFALPIDLDMDGVITVDESAAIVFDTTASNPHGAVNYFRRFEPDHWLSNISKEGLSLFLQHELQRGKWTFNTGVRAERWEHFDSAGTSFRTFNWEVAPRVSAIVDLKGDGKQKLSVFYGRYYDPLRIDATSFVGTLLEPAWQRQVFVNGEWVTFMEGGGPGNALGLFAPTLKTPYTDEWQLGYEIDLGRSMSLTTNLIKRKTRDLVDDYDISTYASWETNDPTVPSTFYPGCWDANGWVGQAACDAAIAHPDSLYLGLDYFGLTEFPDRPWIVANLAGGYRDYTGLELIFRKRLVKHWQGLASYSYADAQGNSSTDSDGSPQADAIVLDPRAPNSTGTIPGTVEHQVKLVGSYRWDNGITLGATYRWYSGMVENRLFNGGVPVLTGFPGSTMDPFVYAGFESNWIEYGSVGGFKNPAWDVLDLRAQYNRRFGSVSTEFFVDVFSVFNSQKTWRRFPVVRGFGWIDFNEPWGFAPPRRFYLGARMSF